MNSCKRNQFTSVCCIRPRIRDSAVPAGWTANAEIRQGTPEDYQVLWRQSDGAVQAASAEMEAYYEWDAIVAQFWAQSEDGGDGKAVFPGANGERLSFAMRQADALAARVPEWQPRVTPQYLPLDEETIQWVLAGIE